MAQCEYHYKTKYEDFQCSRKALPSSHKGYCILHEDLTSKNIGKKKKAFYKEIEEGKTDFRGCILPEINLSNRTIKGSISFDKVRIRGKAQFIETSIKGDAWFNEATLEGDIRFDNARIEGAAQFFRAIIKGMVSFSEATIEGNVWFEEATIEGIKVVYIRILKGFNFSIIQETTVHDLPIGERAVAAAWFDRAKIKGDVSFAGATSEGILSFGGAVIDGNASFEEAKIEGDFIFTGAVIEGNVSFDEMIITGNTLFDRAIIKGFARFERAIIGGKASFALSNISLLNFRKTKFGNINAQEEACRTAKRTQEEQGDHAKADYHFYREMVAKRKQKHWYIRYPEAPLQYIFGYGVKPERIIITWLATVIILALIYWMGDGIEAQYPPLEYIYLSILTASPLETTYLSLLTPATLLDCIYFSIATAATPGYGGYYPKPVILGQLPIYQILAIAEAIFGTFMWAAFIATVARKYMRT